MAGNSTMTLWGVLSGEPVAWSGHPSGKHCFDRNGRVWGSDVGEECLPYGCFKLMHTNYFCNIAEMPVIARLCGRRRVKLSASPPEYSCGAVGSNLSEWLLRQFMGPTWGPSGADRTQVGPMLAPCTLSHLIEIYGLSNMANDIFKHLPMRRFITTLDGRWFLHEGQCPSCIMIHRGIEK